MQNEKVMDILGVAGGGTTLDKVEGVLCKIEKPQPRSDLSPDLWAEI